VSGVPSRLPPLPALLTRDGDPTFRFDVDGDGSLTRDELKESISGLQNLLSSNHRTRLPSVDEYVDLIFEKFDTNKDGVISLEEYKRGATAYPDLLRALGSQHRLDTALAADKPDQGSLEGSVPLHNHRVITWTSEADWNRVLLIMTGISSACRNAFQSENPAGSPLENPTDVLSSDSESSDSDSDDSENKQRAASTVAEMQKFDLHAEAARERVVFPISTDNNVARGTFTDFAPQLFFRLRKRFGISHASYMDSVGIEQILGNVLLGSLSSFHTFESSSKSGASFFFSHDRRYLIKTASRQEMDFLIHLLPEYFSHCIRNENTLLPRFCGLHMLKYKDSQFGTRETLRFVVMTNVFATTLPVHEVYDLKGSTVGRTSGTGAAIMKDLDIVETGRKLRVGKTLGAELQRQIRRDSGFLQLHNIVDYSMLVGVHDRTIERARQETSKVDEKSYKEQTRRTYRHQQRANRRTLRQSKSMRHRIHVEYSVHPVGSVSTLSASCAEHPHMLAAYHVPKMPHVAPCCFACAKKAASSGRKRALWRRSPSAEAKARAKARIRPSTLSEVSSSCPSHPELLASFYVDGDMTGTCMCYRCAYSAATLLEARLRSAESESETDLRASVDSAQQPHCCIGVSDMWHEEETGGVSERKAGTDEQQGDEIYFVGVIE
jgi:Phosphatidylinositol-4-phosphate 5-Kinase/EF-hand domain pair